MRYVSLTQRLNSGGPPQRSNSRIPRWVQWPAILRYVIATVSVTAAIVAAEFLTLVLHSEAIASAMLCAVIFSAWFGGFGPGLLALILCLLAMHYYLSPPIDLFELKPFPFIVQLAELPRLALVAITSLFVNFIISAQRRTRETALRAEAKAARAESEIRLVTDTIPALVWSASPDGALEYVNERWLAYTGLTLEQAGGWGFINAYHPDDRAAVKAFPSVAARHGASLDDVKAEARLRGLEGTYRWFLSRAAAQRDESGNVVRWYGTAIDIDDRKRAEDDLRRSEAYLAEAQRLSVIGSFGWKLNSGDITWSDETYRIFGIDRSLKPTLELSRQRIHPEDYDFVLREVTQVAGGRRQFDIEHRLLMPDGAVKHLHVRSRRVKFAWGDEEVVGAVMDVTAAKEAQEALHAAQAQLAHVTRLTTLSELGASIAHEVNQPLAAVVTNGEACLRWLDRENPDLGEVRSAVKRAVNDANRAAEVIRSVRSLSRKAGAQRALLDVNDVIGEVIDLVRRELSLHRVSLQTELAGALPRVLVDRVQLQQVIINLVMNSIEAMATVTDRRRELTIRSQASEADGVSISVNDNGVGIPTENADRLFSAFVTTKPNGTGMGLSICRSIIQAHGGRIWAEPDLAMGAAFHVRLPSRQEHAS